eukprot:Partr_v1_DN26950_c1_g1_i1_m7148 putative PQ loop repeat
MSERTNEILETTFGLVTLFLWTIQMIPQAVHSYRRKSTDGMAFGLMSLWFVGSVIMCPYVIYIQLGIPLIIQTHVFSFMCWVCSCQDAWYDGDGRWTRWLRQERISGPQSSLDGDENIALTERISETQPPLKMNPAIDDPLAWKWMRLVAVTGPYLTYWILVESLLLYALQATHSKPLEEATAIIPSVFTLIGFMPAIRMIVATKSGAGVSASFIVMDMLGGLSGVVSIAFRPGQFDYLTALLYLSVAFGHMVVLFLKCVVYRGGPPPPPPPEEAVEVEVVEVHKEEERC